MAPPEKKKVSFVQRLPIVAVVVILAMVGMKLLVTPGFLSFGAPTHQAVALLEHQKISLVSTKTQKVVEIDVEVAKLPEQVERGLMFRTSIPEGTGMLFPITPPKKTAFWMKNTSLPLDMLFIRADGVIEKIAAQTKPYDLTPVPSLGPVSAVLEIGGGEAARLGIKVGDSLH